MTRDNARIAPRLANLMVFLMAVAFVPVPALTSEASPNLMPADGNDLGSSFTRFVVVATNQVGAITSATTNDAPEAVNQFFALVNRRKWADADRTVLDFAREFHNRPPSMQPRFRTDGALLTVLMLVRQAGQGAAEWGADGLDFFGREAVSVIPDDSVVFSSSAPAYSVITEAVSTGRRGVVVINPVGLASDNVYDSYVRILYGTRIALCTDLDRSRAVRDAFQACHMTIPTNPLPILKASDSLSRRVFDLNKTNHAFYVEECFPAVWMYAYASPDGPLLKLNPVQIEMITVEVAKRDNEYWTELEARMDAVRGLPKNSPARLSIARCRATIGALYAFHKMWPQAEAAFRQALRIYPDSPQATCRLAEMYESQGRLSDAIALLEQYVKRVFPNPRSNAPSFPELFPFGRSDVEGRLKDLKAKDSTERHANRAPEDAARKLADPQH
jgi:hypothetical protein